MAGRFASPRGRKAAFDSQCPMTALPVDFHNAHLRHWNDAELLRKHNRWANADQLYGFSAECGLKAVMQCLGMPTDKTGKPTERRNLKHVQDLWPQFRSFARLRSGGRFSDMLPEKNPFADWSQDNRYANGKCFDSDSVDSRQRAAAQVCRMVRQAMQGGES